MKQAPPGWQVDLKWVFGILCLVSALLAGGLYSFRTMTSHDTATGLFTGALGGFASSRISDEEYAAIQQAAAQDPEAEYALPGLDQPVRGSDIVAMSKDEAVKLAVSGIAEVNYAEGPDAAEELINLTTEDGEEFSIGPLDILTKKNHDAPGPYLMAALAAALVSAALMVFFSRGPGRVGSAGLVLALATAPYAFAWSKVNDKANGASAEDGVFARTLGEAVAGPAADVAGTFTRLVIAGATLVALSVALTAAIPLARLAWRRWSAWRRARPPSAPADTDAAVEPIAPAAEEPPAIPAAGQPAAPA
jgi:hypothetical protein